MCRLISVLSSVCLILMSVPASVGQEPVSTLESTPNSNSPPIEEITVVGEQSFNHLLIQIEAAELEVFGLFNQLNSNDDFDITCTNEVYTGSHFKQRVCMAAYLRKAQAQNTQDQLNGIDVILNIFQLKGEKLQETQAMEAEMVQLAQENDEFYEALLKLTQLERVKHKVTTENPLLFGQ